MCILYPNFNLLCCCSESPFRTNKIDNIRSRQCHFLRSERMQEVATHQLLVTSIWSVNCAFHLLFVRLEWYPQLFQGIPRVGSLLWYAALKRQCFYMSRSQKRVWSKTRVANKLLRGTIEQNTVHVLRLQFLRDTFYTYTLAGLVFICKHTIPHTKWAKPHVLSHLWKVIWPAKFSSVVEAIVDPESTDIYRYIYVYIYILYVNQKSIYTAKNIPKHLEGKNNYMHDPAVVTVVAFGMIHIAITSPE